MNRFSLLILLLFVILPLGCVFLQPRLTNIDFLTLDLTVFSISLALMTFMVPSLMKFRDSLLEVDETALKKDMSIIEFCKTTIGNFKKLDASDPQDDYKKVVKEAEERLAEYSEKISLLAIVSHIIFNEILPTSDVFNNFVRDKISSMTCNWNLSELKLIVSSYIKLSSLTLQLYFLFMTSEDTMSIIKRFKSELL